MIPPWWISSLFRWVQSALFLFSISRDTLSSFSFHGSNKKKQNKTVQLLTRKIQSTPSQSSLVDLQIGIMPHLLFRVTLYPRIKLFNSATGNPPTDTICEHSKHRQYLTWLTISKICLMLCQTFSALWPFGKTCSTSWHLLFFYFIPNTFNHIQSFLERFLAWKTRCITRVLNPCLAAH